MWGTKRRISTRKARRVMSRVGIVRMRTPRRKRGLWDGEWKCAATARAKQIRVRKVAMGWTTRIEERECRVAEGREKSEESSFLPKRVSMELLALSCVSLPLGARTGVVAYLYRGASPVFCVAVSKYPEIHIFERG